MKTLKLLALASFATFAGFAATADADAALPKASASKTEVRPTTRRRATVRRAKPDLRCRIEAFKDAAGMQPIASGQSLAWGGGNPKIYVRVIVENAGGADAAGFKNVVSIKNNGGSQFSVNETLSLPKGLAKIYPMVTVHLPSITNQITATISADSQKTLSESNEYNNSCSFNTTASVVH